MRLALLLPAALLLTACEDMAGGMSTDRSPDIPGPISMVGDAGGGAPLAELARSFELEVDEGFDGADAGLALFCAAPGGPDVLVLDRALTDIEAATCDATGVAYETFEQDGATILVSTTAKSRNAGLSQLTGIL